MVASFHGPLTLHNRRYVDHTAGFLVEFDTAIRVRTSRNPIKLKLRLDNAKLRHGFASGACYQAIVTVYVSTLSIFMCFTF